MRRELVLAAIKGAGQHVCQRRLLRLLAVMLLVVVALFAAGFGALQSLPGVDDAPSRVEAMLIAHHGVPIGPPPPARLAAATIAVEDKHFYANFAVNIVGGAARAGLSVVREGGDPGGSTITQQLAKALYGAGSGWTGTLREVGLAVKLSLRFSPRTILSMYLNAIYYGNGYWGEGAAARGYFRTSPRSLTWAEAAMLAGLPQAPTDYDPLEHLALAKQRQRQVLDQLVATHTLTREQAAAAYQQTLSLR